MKYIIHSILTGLKWIMSTPGKTHWHTEMGDVRGLDEVIFADSQLNYQFEVRVGRSSAT